MKFSEFILNESLTRNQARALFFKVYEKVFKEFKQLGSKYDVKVVGDDKEELDLQLNDWYSDDTETSLTVTFMSNEFKEDRSFAKEFAAALKKEVNQMKKFVEPGKIQVVPAPYADRIHFYFSLKLPKAN